MNANGTGKTPVHLGNGGKTGQKVQRDMDSINGVNHLVQQEKRSPDEQFSSDASNGKRNEWKNSLQVADNSASWKCDAGMSDEFDDHRTSFSSGVYKKSSNEQCDECTTPKIDCKRTSMVQHSSALEISQSKHSSLSPSPRAQRGLDHCITAPMRSHKNLFLEGHEIAYSRSMTEKGESTV